MSSDLAGVLQSRAEEMISGATTRLVGRPEFLYERAVVAGQVRRCVLAL
ncbi:MAG: hypothetical protein HUU35_08470, partial [Armatimonadetes bacterium]|nr:hypothetical protein [Armatimonadota bacterium]